MTIDGLLDRRVAEATGAALWDGYRKESGALRWDQVKVHTALALLRLAPEKFRARLADWPMRIEMIIDRADALISSLRQAKRPRRRPDERCPGHPCIGPRPKA